MVFSPNPRIVFTITACTLAFFALSPASFAEPPASPPSAAPDVSPDALHALEAGGLHNTLRYGRGVIGGSAPEEERCFDALASIGVKTIVSVDGATPLVESAERHGMRYIHIPTLYAGVGEKESLQLAKALRDAPRPIYVHCHHGKHRGPAAAVLGLVELGELDNDAALVLLKEAGTSPSYPGLFACVRDAKPVDDARLNDPSITLSSSAIVTGVVGHMAAVDRHFDNLKTLQAAKWTVPVAHPDLVPSSEAGIVENHFRSLLADKAMAEYDDAFRNEARDAHLFSQLLEDALVANNPQEADAQFKQLSDSCSRCHDVYRNTVGIR